MLLELVARVLFIGAGLVMVRQLPARWATIPLYYQSRSIGILTTVFRGLVGVVAILFGFFA